MNPGCQASGRAYLGDEAATHRALPAGHVMESGKISCQCTTCGGDTVRISEFEEHSGASERHLSHSIQLANHGISVKVPHLQPISWLLGQSGRPCCTPLGLSISSESGEEVQELCERVNAACGWEGEPGCSLHKPLQRQQQCRECRQSGTGLLRCGGGCKERAHPECIGFDKDYAVSCEQGAPGADAGGCAWRSHNPVLFGCMTDEC